MAKWNMDKAQEPMAAQSADLRCVRVKPLVWEDIGPHHSKAPLPLFGNIRCESWGGPFQVVWSVPGMCDTFTDGKFPTLEAAKAAAQADYEARILAALEPAPDVGALISAPELQALIAAAQAVVDHYARVHAGQDRFKTAGQMLIERMAQALDAVKGVGG